MHVRNIAIILLSVAIIILILNKRKEAFEDEYDLPKIVWKFWDKDELPPIVQQIQKNNERKLKGWKINFVTNSNIHEYIDKKDFNKNFNKLIIQHKADWIRLYLLKKYGGLWMDASIIIVDDNAIEKLYNESVKNRSQFTAFSNENLDLHDLIFPKVIENWFIMAPKNSIVINEWYNEYNRAVHLNNYPVYRQSILDDGIDIADIRKKDDKGYFTAYIGLQKTFQKTFKDQIISTIINKSERTMLKIHKECDYNSKEVMTRIKNNDIGDVPYIKLINQDRQTGIDISEFLDTI